MKETILVTGGTGFIGSHTTVELQQAGYDVVCRQSGQTRAKTCWTASRKSQAYVLRSRK